MACLTKAVILPDASGSGFGVNDSKTLKNVMDKTGCKIEMSSSKDQTLTFLITGSEAEFRKAKAELTAQFQVRFIFSDLLNANRTLCSAPIMAGSNF